MAGSGLHRFSTAALLFKALPDSYRSLQPESHKVVLQKTAEQTAREEIMWGLNIDALKHFEVKPTKLCENTTFQHFACTISHMLLVYKAYMANEVRSTGVDA